MRGRGTEEGRREGLEVEAYVNSEPDKLDLQPCPDEPSSPPQTSDRASSVASSSAASGPDEERRCRLWLPVRRPRRLSRPAVIPIATSADASLRSRLRTHREREGRRKVRGETLVEST